MTPPLALPASLQLGGLRMAVSLADASSLEALRDAVLPDVATSVRPEPSPERPSPQGEAAEVCWEPSRTQAAALLQHRYLWAEDLTRSPPIIRFGFMHDG